MQYDTILLYLNLQGKSAKNLKFESIKVSCQAKTDIEWRRPVSCRHTLILCAEHKICGLHLGYTLILFRKEYPLQVIFKGRAQKGRERKKQYGSGRKEQQAA